MSAFQHNPHFIECSYSMDKLIFLSCLYRTFSVSSESTYLRHDLCHLNCQIKGGYGSCGCSSASLRPRGHPASRAIGHRLDFSISGWLSPWKWIPWITSEWYYLIKMAQRQNSTGFAFYTKRVQPLARPIGHGFFRLYSALEYLEWGVNWHLGA